MAEKGRHYGKTGDGSRRGCRGRKTVKAAYQKCIIGILVAGITACLCACGGETDGSETHSMGGNTGDNGQDGNNDSPAGNVGSPAEESLGLPEGYVLLPQFEDAGGVETMFNTSLVGNTLYYYYVVYDAKQGTHIRNAYVQEKGKEAKQLQSTGDGKALLEFAAGEDGSLYLLYGEGEKEEGYQTYTLEKRNSEEREIFSADISGEMEGVSSFYDMEAGQDGTLYGLTLEGTVLCWDQAGAFRGSFGLPVSGANALGQDKMCYGLANAGEAGVYAYWHGMTPASEKALQLYDLGKWLGLDEADRENTAPLQVDFDSAHGQAGFGNTMYVFSGYEDGLYMGDDGRLWRVDMEDGSLEAMFSWQDMGLKPGYIREVRRQEGGGFLLYVFDTLEKENYWVSLEPVPASEVPEKKELVLGVASTVGYEYSDSLVSRIDQVALSYNRTHPGSHVTVKEYGKNAITNFHLELLKGEGPDILLETESFFDMEELSGKGAVEDLSPYLAGGDGISAEDIIPGILEAITKEGKISRIPLSFGVDVMILSNEAGQEVMTPGEAAEFMASGENGYVDYLLSPRLFLEYILSGAEMDHYVDADNRSCSFDGKEFAELLEKLALLGDMEMIPTRWERGELFRSGELKAVVGELDCLADYFCIREAFSGSGRMTGFPNSSGELCYPVRLYDWMGINGASEHKEEAWDFIAFCLNYMSRSDNVDDRFAVTREKFAQQTHYEWNGNRRIRWNDYDDLWTDWQDIASTTGEDEALLREIPEHLYFYEDEDLMQVIREEADAFFGGDISAEEAAARIQNRASLVLGE